MHFTLRTLPYYYYYYAWSLGAAPVFVVAHLQCSLTYIAKHRIESDFQFGSLQALLHVQLTMCTYVCIVHKVPTLMVDIIIIVIVAILVFIQ